MAFERTVYWFGKSWNAPICEAEYQIPVPVGQPCVRCVVEFEANDPGVRIPFLGQQGSRPYAYWHRLCWLADAVGQQMAERIEQQLRGDGISRRDTGDKAEEDDSGG